MLMGMIFVAGGSGGRITLVGLVAGLFLRSGLIRGIDFVVLFGSGQGKLPVKCSSTVARMVGGTPLK